MPDVASWRRFAAAVVLAAAAVPTGAGAQQTSEFGYLSLDSLLSVRVHAAARYAQALSDAPASVSVVTAAEIEAFGMRTLGEILEAVPGVYLSDDRNYTYAGVRGFSRPSDYNNRLLVLVNGHPINESIYGAAFVGPELAFDVSVIERVEVVRGPVSALYGTSAMLAVVNIVTAARVAPAIALEGGSRGTLRGQARWGGDVAGGRAVASGMLAGSAGDDLYFAEFDDGSPGSGFFRGRDGERLGGAFVHYARGDLQAQARLGTRHKEIPTGAWNTWPDVEAATRDDIVSVDASWERAIAANVRLGVRSGGQYYHYRGWYPDTEYDWEDSSTAVRGTAGVQLLWDISARQRLVAGIDAGWNQRADYRTYLDGVLDYGFDRRFGTGAIYVQDEFHAAPWLTLTFGGRIEYETDGRAHATPRAAIVTRPAAGTSLKAIYGEAFRAPNSFEANVDDIDYKQVGTLRHERIRTAELVAEQRIGTDLVVRATAFDMRMHELIDLMLDSADDMFFYANRGRADTRGIEFELTGATGAWLLQAGGIAQQTRDPSTGERLTNAPAGIMRVAVSGPLSERLNVGASLRGESSRLTLGTGETASWLRADANARLRITPHLSVGARLRNAFDADYAVPGGVEHTQDLLPQHRRTANIQLEYRW